MITKKSINMGASLYFFKHYGIKVKIVVFEESLEMLACLLPSKRSEASGFSQRVSFLLNGEWEDEECSEID